MSKKKALGRGLSALLSDNSSEDDKLEVDIPVSAPTARPAVALQRYPSNISR
jgi:hypothetical protein